MWRVYVECFGLTLVALSPGSLAVEVQSSRGGVLGVRGREAHAGLGGEEGETTQLSYGTCPATQPLTMCVCVCVYRVGAELASLVDEDGGLVLSNDLPS